VRELSLFTGAGGGLLGTKLLGWEPVGYVEWNKYCQQVIAARIRDGYLPISPIFTDVREFVQSGAAEQYRGIADVVSAGFPCQPFSVAGKQAGADDERNMWPATRDVIRDVRPAHVLLENVPKLLDSDYFGVVLADLAGLGYSVKWGVLGADGENLPHHRARLWMVAHSASVNGNAWGLLGKSLRKSQRKFRGLPGTEIRSDWRGANQGSVSVPIFRDPADGVAAVVGELAALGNGQVPAVVRRAWECLA